MLPRRSRAWAENRNPQWTRRTSNLALGADEGSAGHRACVYGVVVNSTDQIWTSTSGQCAMPIYSRITVKHELHHGLVTLYCVR